MNWRLAALLLAGLALAVFGLLTRSNEESLKNLRTHQIRVEWMQQVISTIGEQLPSNAPGWSVNSPREPAGRSIEIIIFNSQIDVFPTYARRCAAVPRSKIVVCDLVLIDQLLHRLELDVVDDPSGPNEVPNSVIRRSVPAPLVTLNQRRKQLAFWILAHEVGHLVLGHTNQALPHGGFFAPVSNLTISERRELEADEFVVSLFDQPRERDFPLYSFFLSALNIEIKRSLCPSQSVRALCSTLQYGAGVIYSEDESILFQPGSTHPEYVIRLLRLIALADDRYNFDLVGYTARRAMLRLRNRSSETLN